jgi:4-amino-4-deoxy-L-arabinose transferase-like glycosyltransferase
VAVTAQAPQGVRRGDLAPAALTVAGVVVFHVALSGRYGFHGDELVTLEAGRRLAFGYVDRAPVVPLVARGLGLAVGDGLWPLRLVAGLVHAGLVAATVVLAGRFGGRRQALALAALAAALLPAYLALGSVFRPATLDALWWALALVLVARLVDGADPREWLALGAVFGVGVETRWTILLLAAGLAVGCVALPEGRRLLLAGRWPWLGAAVAFGLWLPNLAWQAGHGWPAFDLADAVARGPALTVSRQLVVAGPGALAVAGAGLVWLARRPRWRLLAMVVAATVGAAVVAGSPAAVLAPLYVVPLAAGAVAFDAWIVVDADRWRRVMTFLVLAAVVAVAAATPLLAARDYGQLVHDVDRDPGEEVGWPGVAALVVGVTDALPRDEIPTLRVVTATAAEAAALDHYGPGLGMPRGTALSADNAYAGFWPDGEPDATVLFLGYTRTELAPYCAVVGPLAVVGNDAGVPNSTAGAPISFCSHLSVAPGQLRAALRRLG